MTKIAYNKCFGGFGLSETGFEALLERKGIVWKKAFFGPEGGTFYINTNDETQSLSPYDFYNNRTDPDLIAVIEELGTEADGWASDLQIRELPVGTRYLIREYDGMESVVTEAEHDWSTA